MNYDKLTNAKSKIMPGGYNSAFMQWNKIVTKQASFNETNESQASEISKFINNSTLSNQEQECIKIQQYPQVHHAKQQSQQSSLATSCELLTTSDYSTSESTTLYTPQVTIEQDQRSRQKDIRVPFLDNIIGYQQQQNQKKQGEGAASEANLEYNFNQLRLMPHMAMLNYQLATINMINQHQSMVDQLDHGRGRHNTSDENKFNRNQSLHQSNRFINAQNFNGIQQFNEKLQPEDIEMLDNNSLTSSYYSCENRSSSVFSDTSTGSIGSLTRDQRRHKVRTFWEKKRIRKSNKHLRYECRRNLAEKRYRYQGKFVKYEQIKDLDPSQIYDPYVKIEPKTKPIFKVIRPERSLSNSLTIKEYELLTNSIERVQLESLQTKADKMNLFQADPHQEFIEVGSKLFNEQDSQQCGLPEFTQTHYGISETPVFINNQLQNQRISNFQILRMSEVQEDQMRQMQQKPQQLFAESHQLQFESSEGGRGDHSLNTHHHNQFDSSCFEPPLFN